MLPIRSSGRQIAAVDAADVVNAFDVFDAQPAQSLRNLHLTVFFSFFFRSVVLYYV